MKQFKAYLSLILLAGLIISLNTRFGSVPPIGKFFDPVNGFWANAETKTPESMTLSLSGLKEEVEVFFDERRVPHIFAQNEHDLYYTQGYITAMLRLFQMEIQTYDAAGRISELLGENEGIQNRDLRTRRWGMTWAAEKKEAFILSDSALTEVNQAYSKGVNAWVSSLKPADYPLEYKILDLEPEEWTPLKTAQLHMNMNRTLAGGSSDDRTSNTLAFFGEDFVEKFFGTRTQDYEPIIPPSKKWDFDPVIPEAPESLYVPTTAERIQFFDPDAGVGSNNWAISGEHTKSGYPILAGDPHLSLSMPSIWLEMQLHSPEQNVYGVAFQGIPGILIGFNENVAFTETNTGSDVLDWYEITFKDDKMDEYWYNGAWRKTTKRIEELKIRGAESIIDTVVFTHHGPVMVSDPGDSTTAPSYHAMRWIAHEAGSSLKTFLGLNKAKNFEDYREALSNYVAPAQNFLFATNEGDIAISVNGRFPNKWKYQGRTVSDGSDPAYDWQGWIPFEHNPYVLNPSRGFVSSANQESADESYPYYLGENYAPYERGRRINDLLRDFVEVKSGDVTPQDMMDMQMDDYSLHAESIMPELIAWVYRDSLSEDEEALFDQMFQWDYTMNADLIQPSVFYFWWRNFNSSIFNDEYYTSDQRLRYPSRDRVIEVIKEEPDFFMIDDITTDKKETLRDIATKSFKQAYSNINRYYGDQSESWNWGWVMNNDIEHVGQIPGLGVENVYSDGSYEVINATRFGYGPSWRMVVELGPEVKGWGVYPGGTTGNPGSPNYDAFIENWRTGDHFELNFYREKPNNSEYSYTLKPEEN